MSKHTPGPWVAEPGGGKGSWVKGPTGEWAALACGDTSESAEANARLIAAAPDMLDALKEVKRLFEYRGDDATAFAAKVEAEIVAALAKAEGQS